MQTIIYHNPKCSKSRHTLQLLVDNNVEPEIVEYLKTPPNHQQLDSILRGLDMQPEDLMRKSEDEYKQLDIAKQSMSRDQLIDIMIKHPKLIERPIVIAGDKIAIGRPPESVLEIL